LFDGELKKTF